MAMMLALPPMISATNCVWVDWPGAAALYVADSFNHAIRRVTPDATSTMAGSGHPGHTDGVGTAAQFNQPRGITASRSGHALYVADERNGVVRSVICAMERTSSQREMTAEDCRVRTMRPAVSQPEGIFLVGSALYVTDRRAQAIRRILLGTPGDEATTIIEGGHVGTGGLRTPSGLASDGSHLFVADTDSDAVHRLELDGAHGAPRTAASPLVTLTDCTGSSLATMLRRPHGLALHGRAADGTLYVADYDGHSIRALHLGVCDPSHGWADRGVRVSTLGRRVRGEESTGFDLSYPRGLSLDAALSALWVTDSGHRIQRLGVDGRRHLALGKCGFSDGRSDDRGAVRFRLAGAPCTAAERGSRDLQGTRHLPHSLQSRPHQTSAREGSAAAREPNLFCLFAYPRSATTWLLTELESTGALYMPERREMLLDAHPTRRGQQLRDWRLIRARLRMLQLEARQRNPRPAAAGFSWPITGFDEEFMRRVRLEGRRFQASTLILVRRGCGAHFVSFFHAPHMSYYSSEVARQEAARFPRLNVSIARVRRWCNQRNRAYDAIRRYADSPILLSYERLTTQPLLIDAVAGALGVLGARRAPHRSQVKFHAAHPREYVSNWAELADLKLDYQAACGGGELLCLI